MKMHGKTFQLFTNLWNGIFYCILLFYAFSRSDSENALKLLGKALKFHYEIRYLKTNKFSENRSTSKIKAQFITKIIHSHCSIFNYNI